MVHPLERSHCVCEYISRCANPPTPWPLAKWPPQNWRLASTPTPVGHPRISLGLHSDSCNAEPCNQPTLLNELVNARWCSNQLSRHLSNMFEMKINTILDGELALTQFRLQSGWLEKHQGDPERENRKWKSRYRAYSGGTYFETMFMDDRALLMAFWDSRKRWVNGFDRTASHWV